MESLKGELEQARAKMEGLDSSSFDGGRSGLQSIFKSNSSMLSDISQMATPRGEDLDNVNDFLAMDILDDHALGLGLGNRRMSAGREDKDSQTDALEEKVRIE